MHSEKYAEPRPNTHERTGLSFTSLGVLSRFLIIPFG
jgi:hypothetical protein